MDTGNTSLTTRQGTLVGFFWFGCRLYAISRRASGLPKTYQFPGVGGILKPTIRGGFMATRRIRAGCLCAAFAGSTAIGREHASDAVPKPWPAELAKTTQILGE
jgi:hypothetical protein